MDDYVDIMEQNFQPYELRDLKPEVRAVYDQRMFLLLATA